MKYYLGSLRFIASKVKGVCVVFCAISSATAMQLSFGMISVLDANKEHADSDTVSIRVADLDELWEYQFIVGRSAVEMKRTATYEKSSGRQSPWQATLQALREKQRVRKECAKRLDVLALGKGDMAEYSPDSLYLFIGVTDPHYVPPGFVNKVYIFHVPSKSLAKEMRFVDDIYVEDLLWSTDRRYVVMLLEQEKIKYSIYGILRRLVGHPIVMITYSLRVLDLSSGNVKDLPIVQELENGIAILANE